MRFHSFLALPFLSVSLDLEDTIALLLDESVQNFVRENGKLRWERECVREVEGEGMSDRWNGSQRFCFCRKANIFNIEIDDLNQLINILITSFDFA